VALKIHVFLDVTMCRLVHNYRRFEHNQVVHEGRLGRRHCDVSKGGNHLTVNTVSHLRRRTFNRNIRSKSLSAYRCYPTSGVDKAPVYPAAQVDPTRTQYFIFLFLFEVNSFLPTEGSIPDPRYEV
jgi:hypothetical protein